MGGEQARVAHHPEASRFEVCVGEVLAGVAEYRLEDGVMTLTHTRVDPAYEGRGLGSRLVRAALAEARQERLAVRPLCSFVRAFLERHPDDAALVAEGDRRRFGLGEGALDQG